jgi:hypothetical protein
MEKTKRNQSERRLSYRAFVALWVGGSVGAWLTTLGLWEILNFRVASELPLALLIGIVPGLLMSLAQKWVVWRGLRQPMRGWLVSSGAGLALTTLAYALVLRANRFGGLDSIQVQMLALFVPLALTQSLWLHRRVHHAWLWAAGGGISALVFGTVLQINMSIATQGIFLALAALTQGIITASIMRHLWSQPRDKRKSDALEQAQAIPARLLATDASPELPAAGVQPAQEARR